jgi:hypothetical protein
MFCRGRGERCEGFLDQPDGAGTDRRLVLAGADYAAGDDPDPDLSRYGYDRRDPRFGRAPWRRPAIEAIRATRKRFVAKKWSHGCRQQIHNV